MEAPRRILITNRKLSGRTGTEIVTKRLAVGLSRRGHDVIVYSPSLGEIADEIRRAGVVVTDQIARVHPAPDIIHCHHTETAASAIARFPNSPALFVCHDFVAWHDSAPLLPSIRRYLGITPLHVERMVNEDGVAREQCSILRNAIDLEAFSQRLENPERPKRAAVFAKGRAYLIVIRAACQALGIDLDEYGSSIGKPVADPQKIMPEYDLIFASGMTAMEAMSCGCGVVLCDSRGLASFCTADNFQYYYDLNFGLRTLTRRIDVANLSSAIESYDAQSVLECTKIARSTLDFERYLDEVEEHHAQVVAEHFTETISMEHQARALAVHLEKWSPSADVKKSPALVEIAALKAELDQRTLQLGPLAVGEEHKIGDDHEIGWFRPLFGFGRSEPWGRWTVASCADFMIALPPALRKGCKLSLKIQPALIDKRAPFTVRVASNAKELDTWLFDIKKGGQPAWRDIQVPESAIGDFGEVHFSLAISDTIVPIEHDINQDRRALGIRLQAALIE